MTRLIIAAWAAMAVAGAARGDIIDIACGNPAHGDEVRITIDTVGSVREQTPKGIRTYQGRVLNDEIDFVADRQPFEKVSHRIDRRAGVDHLTIYSYQRNSSTEATLACRRTSVSANVF